MRGQNVSSTVVDFDDLMDSRSMNVNVDFRFIRLMKMTIHGSCTLPLAHPAVVRY